MKIANVNIYCEDHTFRRGSVHVEHGRIAAFFVDENHVDGDYFEEDRSGEEDKSGDMTLTRKEDSGENLAGRKNVGGEKNHGKRKNVGGEENLGKRKNVGGEENLEDKENLSGEKYLGDKEKAGVGMDPEETEMQIDSEVYDGKGSYLIPGLVDIHFHGCMGVDFCDALPDGIARMAQYEASIGVTSICPASMTMSKEELHGIMKMAGEYEAEKENEKNLSQVKYDFSKGKKSEKRAHFVGINMEGPFISKEMKGAQAEENVIPCDVDLFRELQKESGNMIRLVDVAPEEAGAMEFIEEVAEEVNISIAHTKAGYDTAMEAFGKGARHVTHLYNAMTPLHHRNPGVIAAAADSDAEVEIICDGIHVHPSMVRNAFRMFDPSKICLISDSMRATGLSDGEYTLGGQKVYVKDSLATLEDGTIAGSVTNLMDCMKNAVKNMGIPLETAIACASENPAKSIGIFDEYGSISVGKHADLVLLDEELKVLDVFVDGERV